jgi:hypothetical protein
VRFWDASAIAPLLVVTLDERLADAARKEGFALSDSTAI